jgi:hypothetical protein
LAPVRDSLALAAVDELLSPGPAGQSGSACRLLSVDTPLFAQLGAVDPPADSVWCAAAARLGDLAESLGVRLAERSLLGHTTGPCFPPYHVDLRACGDSAAVAAFLEILPRAGWPGFRVAAAGAARTLLLSAGTSLQSPEVSLGLLWLAEDR